ncbi:hypothetical protein OHU11_13800 [Streptomyces sp. NBC_00257]|uniref:hypothetical protein n=1 Tax=unclassified Streptomyces TaxID=2593676 RepID=UPI00225733C8|nr:MULTISPECIES: hypothetical protein [unclassified Streptomyces]MCX5428742.1 hypothetical protein [Streptomyces sp. NBC_00062]WTB57022.1 hypothetical protein OG832_29620 [Streptomyces sp. NBC_00826]WTH90094.1 hypothetical protein OIC43_14075 [Streptomyces sp. NBC_00825]WTH98822.1 hypothetical protein OHA23_14060 [Streptomyces sp. NBC_00822]
MSVSRTFAAFLKHGGKRRSAPGTRKLRIPVVGALVLVLSVPAGLTPLAVAADPLGRPDVPAPLVSKVRAVSALGAKEARERVAKNRAANSKQAAQARSEHAARWPKASHTTQEISGKPGTGPVLVTAPRPAKATTRGGKPPAAAAGAATVNVLDQKTARKAGVVGVVFTAAAESPGTAAVNVDYSTFADAIGGNWGSRLGLVSLPACALTSPQKAECRTQTPVPHRNDATKQSVSAQVSLQQTTAAKSAAPTAGVFAVTATADAPASASGDYKATPLAASSSWEAGGSSGAFTWSYPISVPPPAAGPAPSLSLSYDSGSTDGRTSNTNNQGSMLGEGFDLTFPTSSASTAFARMTATTPCPTSPTSAGSTRTPPSSSTARPPNSSRTTPRVSGT